MPSVGVRDIRVHYEGRRRLAIAVAARGAGSRGPLRDMRVVRAAAEASRMTRLAGALSCARMAADVARFSDGTTVGLVLGMTRPELLRTLVCAGANEREVDKMYRSVGQPAHDMDYDIYNCGASRFSYPNSEGDSVGCSSGVRNNCRFGDFLCEEPREYFGYIGDSQE